MRYIHEKTGIVIRLALLALLLATQGLLYAHEIDHLDTGDSSLCAVCSIGNGLDTPVHHDHNTPDSKPAGLSIITDSCQFTFRVNPTPLTARGPPPAS